MQLIPSTARRFGVTNSFDVRENIEAGVTYLKYLLDMFGDDRLAVAAYNAGESAVTRYGDVPPYRETVNYVSRVGKALGAARQHTPAPPAASAAAPPKKPARAPWRPTWTAKGGFSSERAEQEGRLIPEVSARPQASPAQHGSGGTWKRVVTGSAAALAVLLGAAGLPVAARRVGLRAVRFYSTPHSTTVTVELDAAVTPRKGSVGNPPRVFFDLPETRVQIPGRGTHVIPVGDGVVSQIRVAQYSPSVARVVLELEYDASVEVSVLTDPVRLSFEVRPRIPVASQPAPKAAEPPAPARTRRLRASRPVRLPPRRSPGRPSRHGRQWCWPIRPSRPRLRRCRPNRVDRWERNRRRRQRNRHPSRRRHRLSPRPASCRNRPWRQRPSPKPGRRRKRPRRRASPYPRQRRNGTLAEAAKPAPEPESPVGEGSKPVPAARNSGGGRSLIRALGLKVWRMVIDPGHGGHDTGTAARRVAGEGPGAGRGLTAGRLMQRNGWAPTWSIRAR